VRDIHATGGISKWEDADDAIRSPTVAFCLRRKVALGEIIKLEGHGLQIAAISIELARDGKLESSTQPPASAPTPATQIPPSATSDPNTKVLSDFETGDLSSPLFPKSKWTAAIFKNRPGNTHSVEVDPSDGASGTSKSMRWSYQFKVPGQSYAFLPLTDTSPEGADFTIYDTISFFIKRSPTPQDHVQNSECSQDLRRSCHEA
jgi:hypothetical protein